MSSTDTPALNTPAVQVPADIVATVTDLYTRGLYQQAYAAAVAHSPLRSWRNTDARLIGGRLAMNIGAPRLGSIMHVAAWRQDRAHPEARYYYARRLAEFSGPYIAWRFMRDFGDFPADAATADIRADWYAFHAYVIGRLRDFDQAEEWMKRAEQLSSGQPWLVCERSYLFELEDRYADALAAAKHALEIRPWFRPGVQQTAHLLQLLDRDREALDLLLEAAQHSESPSILGQTASLQTELQLYPEARNSYARCRELSPLLEEHAQIGLAMMESDAAYYCGDLAKAAEHAKASAKNPFYVKFSERLVSTLATPANTPRRVILNVGFVRQHHMTCAPATLSALSRFWSRPYDQLDVAEQICYDGTPAHSERNWAIKSGWLVKEFTLTWENARALIDRGVPFTLTTIEATSGHLQAVIGYDELRGTLLVRDPYERHFREFILESTLERYRAFGPRCMALVPPEKSELLAGITFDDEALYDELFILNRALETHDRARAWQAYQAMESRDAGHRLTILARRTLAGYDSDYTTLLACAEAALKLCPGDAGLMLQKLNCLRYLARRDQRLELLRTLCHIKRASTAKTSPTPPPQAGSIAEAAEKSRFDPVFWLFYAQELCADARNDAESYYYIRKCIRYRPFDGAHYNVLANILWDRREFERATEGYRIASCLAAGEERYVRSYFIAAQHQKTQAAALNFVEQRYKRNARLSSAPARTLYTTLEALDRQTDAFGILEDAIKLRPDDGEFQLFAANAYEAYGRHARAAELLAGAEKRSHRSHWLRTSAILARNRGNLLDARKHWDEIVALEPLAFDAHRALAQLIAELEGRAATHAYLKQCCERFPFNFMLHQLRTEWLRDDDPVAAEAVVRHLLELDAADAWTHRELAGALMRQRKFEDGLREADTALQLDPSNTFGHCVRARLLLGLKRREPARESYRAAIRLAVDSHFAIRELIACCETIEQKRAELAFIHEQIVAQVNFGDGLLAYRSEAADALDPETLLAALRAALAARQDLWHAWSAVIQQLTQMNRLDEALKIALEATAQFPLIGHLWHDLASVYRGNQDFDGRIAALQVACDVDPSYGFPVRELADAHAARGDLATARSLLEQVLTRAPLDHYSHGRLADIEWRLGEREAALKRLQHALKLDPGYGWAWSTLRDWSAELKRPELAADLARELTRQRPADTKAWMTLARTLDGPARRDERLAIAEKVIALDPYHAEGHDLRATTLFHQKRLDDARAACRPSAFGSNIPTMLLGREAWIEAESGDRKKAIALLKDALARDPVYTWGWARLADWAESLDDFDTALHASEQLVQHSPQDAVPYGYRGNARLMAKKDREGAKSDLRRALELQPDYRYAALKLFDVLVEDNDLIAARSVLDGIHKHLPNDGYILARYVTTSLRQQDSADALNYFSTLTRNNNEDSWPLDNAFSALEKANLKTNALDILKASTEAQPDAFYTWQKLAELLDENANEEYLKASEAMVRIRPAYSTGYGFLGNAKKKLGKPGEAMEHFKKALDLDPHYAYAARCLFDLQFDAKKNDDATATLALLEKIGKDEFYELRGVKLALQKKDTASALDHFRALCRLTQAPRERLQSALEQFTKADALHDAQGALDELVEQSPRNKSVPELWIAGLSDSLLNKRATLILKRLDNFKGNDEGRRELAVAYLELLKTEKSKTAIRTYVASNKDFLSANINTWGSVGYVLSSVREDQDCVLWLEPWKERKEVKPWMLLNLVLSLRRLKRLPEARDVGLAAQAMPVDSCSEMHGMWIAADAVLGGDYVQGRELLQKISRPALSNYYKFMHDLLTQLLAVEKTPEAERSLAFKNAMSQIADMRKTYFKASQRIGWGDPLLLDLYKKVITQAGGLGGTFVTRTHAWLHCLFSKG